jgi:hypothetical protein
MPVITKHNPKNTNKYSTGKIVGVNAICMFCQGTYEVDVDAGELKAFKTVYAQISFEGQSVDYREQLINGSHTDCYDKAFPEE